MEVTMLDRELFFKDTNGFLESTIRNYVAESPGNRLPDFNNVPIFDEPLIGFAAGDDAIFQEYKSIIGDFHLTPGEALARHLQGRVECGGGQSTARR